MKIALLLALTFVSLPAWGQAASRPGVTVLDFDLDVIEGSLDTPDVEAVQARDRAVHASVVKIRRDFRAQILSSARGL